MTRLRVVPAALAAGATIGVALPFLPLFQPNSWLRVTVLLVLIVGVAGVGMRRVSRSAAIVVAGQLVIGLVAILLLLLRSTLWYALPTVDTVTTVTAAVPAFVRSVTEQAAPVAATAPVILVLAVVFVLLAVSVDALAVTKRMPGAAGIPLLTAYVAAASNSTEGLAFTYFLIPAAAWVALLAHEGTARLVRWGAVIARPRGGQARNPAPGILTWARGVALIAIAAAVVLPGVLPHLPPRFIADGLARGDRGGNGVGSSLQDTLAVAQHLGDRSTQPVLRYETDDPNPPPMRVDVLNQYSDGVWRPTSGQLFDTGGELPATDASEAIARRTPTTRVTDNRMAAPQLPLPGTPLTIDVAADRLRVDANGMVKRVGEMDSYAVNYELVEPSQAQLRAADPRGSDRADDLAIDAMSADYVSAILDEVAPADLDAAEQAWRIQAWLRSARFTYSLDLATPVAFDDTGRAVPLDPLSQFLATRRGYCVQFATAMVMMARHRGIPARVAIGFLPGTLNGREWTVRSADAHAWPELYFPSIGWVRFEPTPGTHTGQAPGWTIDAAPTTGPSATTSAPSTSATAEASDSAAPAPTTSEEPGLAGVIADVGGWLRATWIPLTTILLVAISVLITPLLGSIRRRRALRRARDDAERTEVLWQSLLDRLDDIEVRAGPGETPRQARDTLTRSAYLDGASTAALDTVVATLERARYAAPGVDLPDITADSELVARTARSRRRLTMRIRAWLWPLEGRRAWGEMWNSVDRRGR